MMLAATLYRLPDALRAMFTKVTSPEDQKPQRPDIAIRANLGAVTDAYYKGCTCTLAFIQNQGDPTSSNGMYTLRRAVETSEGRYILSMMVNQNGALIGQPSKEVWPKGLKSLAEWEQLQQKSGNIPLPPEKDHLGALFHYRVDPCARENLIKQMRALNEGGHLQHLK